MVITILSGSSLWGGQGDWTIQTVDYTTWPAPSLALDSEDHPHICYSFSLIGGLYYASGSEGRWTVETLAGSGLYPSLALDTSDQPHVSYFGGGALKYVSFNGSSWSYQTVVDHVSVYNYKNAPLCLDSLGYPHLVYETNPPEESDVLNYVYWDGTTWQHQTVMETGCSFASQLSMALDRFDNPHISYSSDIVMTQFGRVKYATTSDGTNWTIETVVFCGETGYTSLAIDSKGDPHIAYDDNYNNYIDINYKYIGYASRRDGSWMSETVNLPSQATNISLALDSSDNPHIAYRESHGSTDGNLMYMLRTGDNWLIQGVDWHEWGAYAGQGVSLALDSRDQPRIAYGTYGGVFDPQSLKYAEFDYLPPLPLSPPVDYNGDGTSDIGFFRDKTGLWAIRGITRFYFGHLDDDPVAGDYDGNGTGEIGIFRRASGLWAIRNLSRLYFGRSDDEAVSGDFNGDGMADIGVFRDSTGLWAVRDLTRRYFGAADDKSVPRDYNGDGTTEIALFRGSSGLWAVRSQTRVYFGNSSDQPVPDNFDGNDSSNITIFREDYGLWAIRGETRLYFGGLGDQPASGDYDGDGTTEVGIFRASSGLWAIRGLTRLYYGMTE
jgi:hypothetical protein